MADRPRCFVAVRETVPLHYRPADGKGKVESVLRPVSDLAGLTQMGVKVRETPPGRAGTLLHFHDTEEEWAFLLSGRGRLELAPLSIPVRAGHFVAFPPTPSPHHFVSEGDEPLVLLEGGERRPAEDACTYPELGVRSRDGVDEPIDVGALPAPAGSADQLVHLDDVPERARPHPLSPAAVRHVRGIDASLGLSRQGCTWARLEPGIESTTYHTHDKIDEWVYILSGDLDVRIGDDWYTATAGDFIAHPARGPAHLMRARTPVTYLMGGQSIPDDVVTYPERRMILGPEGFRELDPPAR